ncbi:MAG: type II secretion system F family protein [Erysipelotrichales bacterium]|nr:type II secretion system F family protein [Erysipelotrichales bacterium]
MPVYKYTALDINNKSVRGYYRSNNPTQLYIELAAMNLYVKGYSVVNERMIVRSRLKPQQLSIFCNQVSTMLISGMSLSKSLELLYGSEKNKLLRSLYLQLFENIQKGYTLSESMRMCNIQVSPYLIQMIRSGEKSGTLEKNLERMAIYYEKEFKMKNKISGAMTYPIILLVMTIVVVIGLMTFVMPRFTSMFEGAVLPWNTKLLIALSNLLVNHFGLIAIITIALGYLVYRIFQLPEPKRKLDKLMTKIIVFGPLYMTVLTSRFSRTFSSLYACGIPVLDSLHITSEVISNTYVRHKLELIAEHLKRGESLSKSIGQEKVFNPLLQSMLYVGEQSGDLPELLELSANYFDEKSDVAIERMVTLLQPLMIVVMALIIAFVLFSVIVPIYQMMGTVS